MSTLLLDTRAFVWAVSLPERLGSEGRDLIKNPTNQLLVSAATAWELATKVRLGKFPEAEPLVARYKSIVDTLGADELAVEAAHALRAGTMPWDHRDPFDRMLAAQAMIEGAVLVTRDAAFADLPGLAVVW